MTEFGVHVLSDVSEKHSDQHFRQSAFPISNTPRWGLHIFMSTLCMLLFLTRLPVVFVRADNQASNSNLV